MVTEILPQRTVTGATSFLPALNGARITSLGHAVPDKVVMPMEKACDFFGYTAGAIRLLARNTRIKEKRWWCDPRKLSVQELSGEYIAGALDLSCRAIDKCIWRSRDLSRIGSFIYVSTTQQLEVCPSMSFRVAGEMGMAPDMRLVDIIGDGCEGALPGLETAYAHLCTFREPVLLISCEICSATYFPAPQEDLENTVSNLIFNDGASALLLEFSDSPEYPRILAFHRRFSPEGKDLLGYRHQEGRMKVILSRDVPKLVPPMVAQVVRELLHSRGLGLADISNWVVHNGGVAILDQIAEQLGLDGQQDFRYSWQVLREYGNLSSASVGVAAQLMHQDPENRHGWVVGVAMGAGAQVNAVLAKYD